MPLSAKFNWQQPSLLFVRSNVVKFHLPILPFLSIDVNILDLVLLEVLIPSNTRDRMGAL